ncbi:hemerythrin domain-containing protein [Massilia sp. TS11]|uniref:hemerythrin domain-containing protein n=1 Tax=Massilia sp. TS11 TaxID=2908003 RepID=UPI001EDC33BB|nr:hemerythrin domain-containing protein [Massilia sp. TS11]MCG2583450.1 hemerythrin domain-containing protein [Massilia sp. TS11]
MTLQAPELATPARVNIYFRIHKALRSMLSDTLVRVGRLDAADAEQRAEVLGQVRQLADFCLGHLQHENEFVHTAMEARQPGSSSVACDDHTHHVHACQHLSMLADQAATEPSPANLHTLYLYLSVFVGDNLLHMNMEETEHNAVLWACYTDAELIAIEQAIVAALSPEESWLSMRWMVPALSPAERLELLSKVRAAAPSPVFAGLIAGLQPYLAAADWSKLSDGLRLAA